MTHSNLIIACMGTPLLTFAVALLFLRRRHAAAASLVIAGGVVSMLSAVWLLLSAAPAPELVTARWLDIAGVEITVGALLDGRSLLMGAIVGVITLCIMVYSLGYMAHDQGKARFFASLALFEWAMLAFAYAPNLLQAFIFWELVGLASFLLIGFWYEKPSAVAAAKKAFIMTRVGDVGMFVGLLWLFAAAGTLDTLQIMQLFAGEGLPTGFDSTTVEIIAGLLFLGVMGKSAQFPLHTWLPDAMEGPTPVSALLHSATMVAAGVFVYARFHELFMDAVVVSTMVLAIATFTALMSSTMAVVANDMKKVLAYSSISQLGFMLMGLAAGSLFAGLFHLTTHAIFKALLFLCAGSYIHHYGTNDIVAIGRAGGRAMKATTLGLVAGGCALAGVPVFAGFWSKEAILGALHGPQYTIFLIGAYAAAFLTAYYTFRMIFLVLRPNPASDAIEEEPAGSQSHDDAHNDHGDAHSDHSDHGDHAEPAAPWSMRAPIVVLAFGAMVAGLPFISDRLAALIGVTHVHHASLAEMALPIGIVLSGALLAWADFGAKRAPQRGLVSFFPGVHDFFKKGWYIDAIYERTAIALTNAIAWASFSIETKALDVAGDRLADGTVIVGEQVARTHTGRLQVFVATAAIVLTIVSLVTYLSWGGAQ